MADIGPRGATLLWWMVAFTIICIIFLLLRLCAARVMRRSFYWDDAFIIISFVSYSIYPGNNSYFVFGMLCWELD